MGFLLIVLSVSMTFLCVSAISCFDYFKDCHMVRMCASDLLRCAYVCASKILCFKKSMCFYDLRINVIGVALLVLCSMCAYGVRLICLLVRKKFACAVLQFRICANVLLFLSCF